MSKFEGTQFVALLGAGASVCCGLPTMRDFVDEWLDVENEEAAKAGRTSLGHWILRGWGHPGHADPRYDLEGLLTILQDLAEPQRPTGTSFAIELGIASLHYPWVRARAKVDEMGHKDRGKSSGGFREWYVTDSPLVDFLLSYEGNREWVREYVPQEAGAMLEHLKEYMVSRLQRLAVDKAQGMFLPLVEFLCDVRRRAYCFSLNYDLILEQAIKDSQWSLERGFDARGRWRGLDTDGSPKPKLILGKMHGSLDWTIDRSGQPVVSRSGRGKDLQPLLVYPIATKQWYRQPFFSLIAAFAESLERSDFLVIVGCSLRDEAISSVISQACHRSKRLALAVVSPSLTEEEIRSRAQVGSQTQVHLVPTVWEGYDTVRRLQELIAQIRN